MTSVLCFFSAQRQYTAVRKKSTPLKYLSLHYNLAHYHITLPFMFTLLCLRIWSVVLYCITWTSGNLYTVYNLHTVLSAKLKKIMKLTTKPSFLKPGFARVNRVSWPGLVWKPGKFLLSFALSAPLTVNTVPCSRICT